MGLWPPGSHAQVKLHLAAEVLQHGLACAQQRCGAGSPSSHPAGCFARAEALFDAACTDPRAQAAFHGLPSSSREAASGAGRSVVVRKRRGAAQDPGAAASRAAAAPQAITCADILFALQDQPAGLTPALLARFVSQHGPESSSEASYVMV